MFQGKFPCIGNTLLYYVDRETIRKTRQEDSIIVKFIRKFGTGWGDDGLPVTSQKAWEWRKRNAAYREKCRKEDEEQFRASGVRDRCNFMSKRETDVSWDEKAHNDCGYPPEYTPKPVPALMSRAALWALLTQSALEFSTMDFRPFLLSNDWYLLRQ